MSEARGKWPLGRWKRRVQKEWIKRLYNHGKVPEQLLKVPGLVGGGFEATTNCSREASVVFYPIFSCTCEDAAKPAAT